MTDTTTLTPTHRITIGHDPDCDSPNEYGMFRLVSFNTRHLAYVDPDLIDSDDILALLSYYEHGLCLWSVGESSVPDYGGFDTVNHAGVIVFGEYATPDDIEHFNSLSPEDQRSALVAFADEYTMWSNGETYYWSIDQLEICDHGDLHVIDSVDGCGGYIGSEWLTGALSDAIMAHNIHPDLIDLDDTTGGFSVADLIHPYWSENLGRYVTPMSDPDRFPRS